MTQTRTLIVSFIAFAVLYSSLFWLQARVGGGPLLDMLISGTDARERLASMSAPGARLHLIGTATVDMLNIVAYSIFFTGFFYRFGGGLRRWLVALPLVTAAFDFSENLVQISALAERADFLDAKLVLTGGKLVFTYLCLSSAAILAVVLLVRSLRGRFMS